MKDIMKWKKEIGLIKLCDNKDENIRAKKVEGVKGELIRDKEDKGLRKGLIIAVFSLLGFFIGLTAALKLSSVVADYIGTITNITQRWLPFIAFILVFIIVVFLVRLGAKMLEKVLQIAMLGWLNKL